MLTMAPNADGRHSSEKGHYSRITSGWGIVISFVNATTSADGAGVSATVSDLAVSLLWSLLVLLFSPIWPG